MKKLHIIVAVLLSLFLIGGYSYADDMNMPMGKMGQGSGMEMMKARQQMMTNMMEMLKETMSILKDLNHKPTAEEREKLGEMIMSMDKMMAKHDEMQEKMHKKMMEMRKGKTAPDM